MKLMELSIFNNPSEWVVTFDLCQKQGHLAICHTLQSDAFCFENKDHGNCFFSLVTSTVISDVLPRCRNSSTEIFQSDCSEHLLLLVLKPI